MNNQNLLFANNFVRNLDVKDTPSSTNKSFRNFHENKQKQNEMNKILNTPQDTTLKPVFLDNTPIIRTSSKIEKITKVPVSTSDRDLYSYPNPNNFEIFLGKTYKNISKIELISTEIPNTDTVIKNLPVELQNNILTWINQEDFLLGLFYNMTIETITSDTININVPNHNLSVGTNVNVTIFNSLLQTDSNITGIIDGTRQAFVLDSNILRINWLGGISTIGNCDINIGYPEYTITLIPGNPTATSLVSDMQTAFNLVKRQNGTGQYHYYYTSLNLYTNVITLESVITTQLPNNPIATIAGSTIITVTSLGHGFYTGDIVLMINVQNTASISGNVLSGNFTVTVIDFNTFTYEVNVPAVSTTNGGGNFVQTGTQAPYQILFKTANTLLQFNTGYSDEDSSEYIGSTDSITTKVLYVNNVQILNTSTLIITTNNLHGLESATIINILAITKVSTSPSGSTILVTTTTQHFLTAPIRVTLRNTGGILDGEFYVYPNGTNTFNIYNSYMNSSISYNGSGQLIFGGDHISITGLKTTPKITEITFFYIDSVINNNQFTINFSAAFIDPDTIRTCIVNTNQVFVNAVNHGINNITKITPIDSTFTSIQTQLPVTFTGSRNDNVSIIKGPANTNTVDILLPDHNLVTSDKITIKNSNTNPLVDGVYHVEVISPSDLRINFVNSTFVAGTGSIITGDTIVINGSTSFPRIDNSYNINNKFIINSISTGTVTSTITLNSAANFNIGDIVTITGSNTTPIIDNTFTIYQILSSTVFTIQIGFSITQAGTSGILVNQTTLVIDTGFLITTSGIPSILSGSLGIIGRDQNIILYRIASDTLNGSTIGGINLASLNGIKFPVVKLIDVNNFMIRVEGSLATSTVTGGGTDIHISSLNKGFRSMQSNTDTGNVSGKLARSINLAGEFSIFLISPGITKRGGTPSLITTSLAVNEDVFAKILLTESPGLMCYNGFISAPFIFSPLLPSLETLGFQMVTKQNYPFNFNSIDYDFTLAITEIVDQLDTTFVSSRTGNNVSGTVNVSNTNRIGKGSVKIENIRKSNY
jgi:hypothetical protein